MNRWKLVVLAGIAGFATCAVKPRPPKFLDDFRVVTFNIRNSDMKDTGERAWRQRRAVAVPMLLQLDPDILGLQEVSPTQRKHLDLDLAGYRGAGLGRDGDGRGEQCPIYSRRGLAIEAEGMFWLSPTPMKPSLGWDAKMPRVCTWIRYPGLTVFNTHLDYAGAQSRRKALQLIRRQARGPAVILGDFNDREGTPTLGPVDDLVDAYRAVHPRVEAGPDGTRVAQNVTTFDGFKKGNVTGPRLDFVFVTPDLEVLEAEIVQEEGQVPASDHKAMVVRLQRRR